MIKEHIETNDQKRSYNKLWSNENLNKNINSKEDFESKQNFRENIGKSLNRLERMQCQRNREFRGF